MATCLYWDTESCKKDVLLICWRLKLWIRRVLRVPESRLLGKKDFFSVSSITGKYSASELNKRQDAHYLSKQFIPFNESAGSWSMLTIHWNLPFCKFYPWILHLPITVLKMKLNHHYFIKRLVKEWRKYHVRLEFSCFSY